MRSSSPLRPVWEGDEASIRSSVGVIIIYLLLLPAAVAIITFKAHGSMLIKVIESVSVRFHRRSALVYPRQYIKISPTACNKLGL